MNKNMIIAVVIIIVVLVGGYMVMSGNKKASTSPTPTVTEQQVSPTEAMENKEATGAMEKTGTMAAATTIQTKNFVFTPATIKVKAGEKVEYTNLDDVGHSLTSDDSTSFDTGVIGKDKSATFTAPTKPGSYSFHCTPHPKMKGILVVE